MIKDNILNIIKTFGNVSYEQIKTITKYTDKTLNINIKSLINTGIIYLENGKYFFSKENYILNNIKIYKPNKDDLYNNIKDITKEEIDNIIDGLLKKELIFLNHKNQYEYLRNDYYITIIDRNSKNKSFVMIDGYKLMIPDSELHTALKNDKVIVKHTFEDKGTVIGIIERKNNKLVCEVKEKNNKLVLVPFNGNVEIHLVVNDNNLLKDLIIGDRVFVKLNNTCDMDNTIIVDNVTKIGHFNDKMNDAIAIAISKDFDIDFSDETMKEVNSIPRYVRDIDKKDRLDLTKETVFTIDSIHTKDMDDAISIKKLYNGNYLLGVHIADVAHYLKPSSSTFKEAKKRGTSVYLDDTVIPMIPSILSNGICSLNEGVDRLTKSVFIEVNPNGKIINHKIVNSVINSKKKMTYEELNDLFNGKKVDVSYIPFVNNLSIMRELSNILSNKQKKNGDLEFKSSDITINKDIYNSDDIIGFSTREKDEAQGLIENFMILANQVVATDFYWKNLPFIYRVHDCPDDIKVDKTIDIIKNLGYKLVRIQNVYGQKALQSILNDFKGTEEYTIISNLLLRSMAKAKYSTNNIGHYALALDNYCHFTSPIRRFPDLIVHTLIDMFNDGYKDLESLNNLKENLDEISQHSSYKERQADDAEKDYIKLKMARYMEKYIGEEFIGKILDIDNDKIFILLDNNIKGILDSNSDILKSFSINTSQKTLVNNYSKDIIKLGSNIKVIVSSVNIPQKEIYFDIKEIIKDKDIKKLELKK